MDGQQETEASFCTICRVFSKTSWYQLGVIHGSRIILFDEIIAVLIGATLSKTDWLVCTNSEYAVLSFIDTMWS